MIKFWLQSESQICTDLDPGKTCLGGGMHCSNDSSYYSYYYFTFLTDYEFGYRYMIQYKFLYTDLFFAQQAAC